MFCLGYPDVKSVVVTVEVKNDVCKLKRLEWQTGGVLEVQAQVEQINESCRYREGKLEDEDEDRDDEAREDETRHPAD